MAEQTEDSGKFACCPNCGHELLKLSSSLNRLQCSNCQEWLTLEHSKNYARLRAICCIGGAFCYAWTHGWNGLWIVFALVFYVWVAMALWDVFLGPVFPKKRVRREPRAFPWIRTLTG